MSYTIQYLSNQYVLFHDDSVVVTPAGNEIRTRFPALLKAALEEINIYGPDPTESIGIYNLICSYTDFGRRTSIASLIDAIFSDLSTDIVFDLPADPEAYRYLRICYDNKFFTKLGINPGLASPNIKKLETVLHPYVLTISRRALTVVSSFATNLGSPLIGIALAYDAIELGYLAQVYCSMLYEYLCDISDAIASGDTTAPWKYEPVEYDELYCNSTCLTGGGGHDYPVKGLTSSCAVVQMIEKMKMFCGYPDE